MPADTICVDASLQPSNLVDVADPLPRTLPALDNSLLSVCLLLNKQRFPPVLLGEKETAEDTSKRMAIVPSMSVPKATLKSV